MKTANDFRRNVVFRSDMFNTTVAKPYFINPTCYGDDVAKWLVEKLNEDGASVAEPPQQEDFGWYFDLSVEGLMHQIVITYRPPSTGESGDWIVRIERAAGPLGTLLGKRSRVSPGAPALLHQALQHPGISDVRWFTDDDFRTEHNPAPTPGVSSFG